jgi:aspartyl-tRNA(Asn)/glutamyl-tRNA(Gln) amidotransferase subunit A
MTNQLNELTIVKALEKLSTKECSIADIYSSTLSSIESHNKTLNAYLTINKDAESEAKQQSGSPLAGLPIAVKDNFSTKGLRTTAAATLLEDFVPQYDATVINRLKKAGGVVVGKNNMDAWAHGSSTETSQFGRTLNPRNTDYLPGGSSGGSAAAVAANMCIAAIGSETAGSIRQPAAWCGVVGIKPTYGRVSRYGVVAMASSTDSPGPITKTVEDGAILLNVLAGHDPYDATTSSQPMPDLTQSLNKPIKGLKIGVIYHDLPGLQATWSLFEPQLKVFEELGAHIELATAMDPEYAIGVYTVVQRSEVSSNLARYSDVRYQHGRETFGTEAKRRIMLGTFTLSKGYADQYYNRAQQVRTLFIKDYEKLFGRYDVLISLTSPGFAKKIGASEDSAMFGELEDMLVEPSSIVGLPGVNVPCYHDPETNLFLGMNIMAPMWREDLTIQVADAFEKNSTWNDWRRNS